MPRKKMDHFPRFVFFHDTHLKPPFSLQKVGPGMNAQCDMILKFPLYVDQRRAYNLTPAVKSSNKKLRDDLLLSN